MLNFVLEPHSPLKMDNFVNLAQFVLVRFSVDSGTPYIAFHGLFPLHSILFRGAVTAPRRPGRQTDVLRSCKTNYPRRNEERASRRRTRILRSFVSSLRRLSRREGPAGDEGADCARVKEPRHVACAIIDSTAPDGRASTVAKSVINGTK